MTTKTSQRGRMMNNHSTYNEDIQLSFDQLDDRVFKYMKYARIIGLIAEKQQIPLEEAMDTLYSSPLFEIIDDGTADLICRSDLYLAGEIIRMASPSSSNSPTK